MKNNSTFSFGRPPGAIRSTFTLAFSLLLLVACSVWEEPVACVGKTDVTGGKAGTALVISARGITPCTKAESWWLVNRVDAFVFNNDGLRELDSYNRSDDYSTEGAEIMSGKGDKIVVVIANAALDDKKIARISRYDDLDLLTVDFRTDDPYNPIMSGEGTFLAGEDEACNIQLTPLMSLIEVSSLSCDMRGEYAGKHLKKLKVYLTGLSGVCEVTRSDGFVPYEIMNDGGLVEGDLKKLKRSSMVYKYLGDGRQDGGNRYSYGYASLYCYPNECREESMGSPYTRLVIEAEMDGEVWKYPIEINREGYGLGTGAGGISRNTRYSLDITITGPPK